MIESMKQALEALESATPKYTRQRADQKTLGGALDYWKLEQHQRLKAITSLRQAIADFEKQEPVAWVHRFIEGGISFGKKPADLDRHPDRWQPLYTDTTPCKTCETLAMSVMADHVYHEQVCPKREWVGLTVMEAVELDIATNHPREFAAAIEAKLKQKNT